MLTTIYVIQVRNRIGRPIILSDGHYGVEQPALFGLTQDSGPLLYGDVTEAIQVAIDLQNEFPSNTYHVVEAGEVQVEVPNYGPVTLDFSDEAIEYGRQTETLRAFGQS